MIFDCISPIFWMISKNWSLISGISEQATARGSERGQGESGRLSRGVDPRASPEEDPARQIRGDLLHRLDGLRERVYFEVKPKAPIIRKALSNINQCGTH